MKKHLIFIFASVILLSSSSWAESENGGYAGAFLKLAVEARPAGMGGAYIAVSDDPAGQLHNPAGIQSITEKVFTSSYRAMKLDRKLGFLSVVLPTRLESALGLSWLYAGYGDVDARDGSGYRTGEVISSNEHAFGVSFAKRFIPFLGLGTKLNYYHKSHAGYKSNSIGINLGAIIYVDSLFRYGTMEDKFITDISAGLVVNNIVAKYPWDSEGGGLTASKDDKFPTVIGLGVSCRSFGRKLLVAFDAEKNLKQNLLVRFGGEYDYRDRLLLRGGLNDGIITAGAGFRFILSRLAFTIDYAFSDDRVGEGDDHIITFNAYF